MSLVLDPNPNPNLVRSNLCLLRYPCNTYGTSMNDAIRSTQQTNPFLLNNTRKTIGHARWQHQLVSFNSRDTRWQHPRHKYLRKRRKFYRLASSPVGLQAEFLRDALYRFLPSATLERVNRVIKRLQTGKFEGTFGRSDGKPVSASR